jgi:hypothetical protein
LNGAPVSQPLISWLLGKGGSVSAVERKPAENAQLLSQLPVLGAAWSWKAPGLISDFTVASKSGGVLVSTIRDIDSNESISGNGRHLVLIDRHGKVQFRRGLESQTRVQALRADGALAYVSNYEHQLEAIEANGRLRWKVDAACKPIPLEAAQAVLCLEDDSAAPERLFRVFDEADGRLVFEKKSTSEAAPRRSGDSVRSDAASQAALDSLSLKKTGDGRYFAIAMTGGNVALYRVGRTEEGAIYVRSLWERTLEGEVSDIALSGSESERSLLPGEAPEVAVLHWVDARQKVTFIEKSGLIHSKIPIPANGPVQQLELSPTADRIWVQGNGLRGQVLTVYRRESQAWAPSGGREMKRSAEYPVAFEKLSSGGVIAGVEESLQGRRRNTLARFNRDGDLLWYLPVISGDGAYIYGHSALQAGDGVVVATDDGKVTAYQSGLKAVAHLK